jgi:hypothetical protein
LKVQARRQGNTLQIFYWRQGLLKTGESEIRMEVAESLEQVLLCATRIALSTDAPLQFVEIKVEDANNGATVTLWRYVPDIRDSMYTRLAEDEYINRLVMEISTDPRKPLNDTRVHWDAPITMEEFLAKQVVLRAKRQSPVGLQAREDLSHPKTLVVVIDNWSLIEKQEPDEQEKVADAIEKSARLVMKGYGFSGFHAGVLQDNQGAPLRQWTF